ncbi:MAG: hypothetical protein RBS91_01125 [Sulfurimonadaceae bacterium]|jgi:hypothetical protein|nr:hypothetical protein [Sulfurimonadaceae bacterium]
MFKRSFFTLSVFGFLGLMFVVLPLYLSFKSVDIEAKKEFVATTALPDLAISTEASFIRHRSLSDFFSAYKDAPELRDYFASSFIYREGAR